MKALPVLLFPLMFSFLAFGPFGLCAQSIGSEAPSFTDQEIRLRLRKMKSSMIQPRYNSVVKSYINTYTIRARKYTQEMLGRATLYFPIFEKHLQDHQLPLDLKVLPIIESGLKPNAVSRSKAVGLWQFMSFTARENGLVVGRYVDERRDPHRSTEAALQYLSKLYAQYQDWALALAAYNGGPGTVNRAIRRGKSKDYWQIRGYLPRETRNYVPAFTAALYVWNHYQLHNLQPIYPDPQLQYTDLIKVYERMTFDEIVEITGVDKAIIEFLNPAYRRGVIPANPEGFNLTLPSHATARFLNKVRQPDDTRDYLVSSYLPAPPEIVPPMPNRKTLTRFLHQVKPGETVYSISRAYNCRPEDIARWNQLDDYKIRSGQRLDIFVESAPRTKIEVFDPLAIRQPQLPAADPLLLPYSAHRRMEGLKPANHQRYTYYYLQRGESLRDVANKFPEVSLLDLMRLNRTLLAEKATLLPGDRIILREKS